MTMTGPLAVVSRTQITSSVLHGEWRTFQVLAEDDGDAAATSRSNARHQRLHSQLRRVADKRRRCQSQSRVPYLGKTKHVETFIGKCFVDDANLVK